MPGNSGYSAAELMTMQRDAAERVRQMQKKARERMSTLPPSPPAAAEKHPHPQDQTEKARRQFWNDPDRLLLILLFLLLSQEDTDPGLLMALVFLLL